MRIAKWGTLTAGRNKNQVYRERKEKERSQEAGLEARRDRRGGRTAVMATSRCVG